MFSCNVQYFCTGSFVMALLFSVPFLIQPMFVYACSYCHSSLQLVTIYVFCLRRVFYRLLVFMFNTNCSRAYILLSMCLVTMSTYLSIIPGCASLDVFILYA